MSETQNMSTIANGAKLVGESMLPGASLMMDGNLKNGAVHAVIGFGARALLGPAGVALVAADSFSKSLTDKYLWDHVSEIYEDQKARIAAKRQGHGPVVDVVSADASEATEDASGAESAKKTTTRTKSS